ncbi:MAG TPA: DUF3267 domain-containing protein [Thermomicrobiales bacterium]|nr:DUF3267 domain-containing protein [Thermomicrobiales bacterium]
MKPWIGDPPRVSAPVTPGHVLASHERFNIATGAITGFVLIPFWAYLVVAAVRLSGGRSDYSVTFSMWTIVGGAFVGLILVPVVHEAIHGMAAVVCRTRPSYGIGPGFAYTTFHEPLRRVPYLFVGLAPLVVLTIACVVVAARFDSIAGWFVFFAVINAGGAIGDLWMSWRIIRQPRCAIFYDLADGFAVLVPEHAVPARAAPSRTERPSVSTDEPQQPARLPPC